MFRDIQQKKRVIAEKIETVTVFYSDLVNFNELYTDSSPIEVGFNRQYLLLCSLTVVLWQMVMMLNSYYKIFEESMSKYQVYKVNCVNDSHMIVSGLPPLETDHHVGQIASMALCIMANGNK